MSTQYPIYVISKNRVDRPLTARMLIKDHVPFRMVIEPQEEQAYRAGLPGVQFLILPFSNLGLGSIPARNWVWEHSRSEGHARHWILDDNIRVAYRRYRTRRIICDSTLAFQCGEEFADRYENVALLALNYSMFAPDGYPMPPFYLNHRCYSCILINNALPHRWRGRYNEDTDLTLQVLSDNWCTVLINAFLVEKIQSMKMKGGNTDELYRGDGRLRMARSLERMWPGVVTVKRRFGRPQHKVHDEWGRFDTQLILKQDADLTDKMNMKAVEVKPLRSNFLREFLKEELAK